MQTLLWPDEVRDAGQLDHLDEVSEPKESEVAMARMLVDSMAGDFEPEGHEDDYQQAVEALVKAKIEGGEVKEPEQAGGDDDGGEVVDLLAALQRSVDRARESRGEKPVPSAGGKAADAGEAGQRKTGSRATARKTAAKKPPAKKVAAKTTEKQSTKKTG